MNKINKYKPEEIYLICNFDVNNIEIAGKNMESKSLLALRCKDICMW